MPFERRSLLAQDTASAREWYFGFTANGDALPWWQDLALKGHPDHLKHVYAFSQVGGFVLFVEPEWSKVDFTVKYPSQGQLCDASEMASELVKFGHVIVKHTYFPDINKRWIFSMVPSCVSVVKVATGFSSCAVTPRGLLRALINSGAEVIN